MGESQTRRASLPWSLLPRPVFHPTAAVLLSVAVSLSKSSEGSKIGVKPSRWPSRSLSRPSAWGPAQGWEVTLAFSIDLRSFCACHRPFLAPRVQPRCSQVLAAQLGFFAGFLGLGAAHKPLPLHRPSSHSSLRADTDCPSDRLPLFSPSDQPLCSPCVAPRGQGDMQCRYPGTVGMGWWGDCCREFSFQDCRGTPAGSPLLSRRERTGPSQAPRASSCTLVSPGLEEQKALWGPL